MNAFEASISAPGAPEGWTELVRGMRDAVAGNPKDLLLLALAAGLVLLFVVNLRIARRVERSMDARAEQRRISHPAHEDRPSH